MRRLNFFLEKETYRRKVYFIDTYLPSPVISYNVLEFYEDCDNTIGEGKSDFALQLNYDFRK